MSALGLRAFSGITVGLLGSLTTVHRSLATSAAVFVTVMSALLFRFRAEARASLAK